MARRQREALRAYAFSQTAMGLTTAPLKNAFSIPKCSCYMGPYLEMLSLHLYKLGEFTLEGDGSSIQRVEGSRQQQTPQLV